MIVKLINMIYFALFKLYSSIFLTFKADEILKILMTFEKATSTK